ncbi:MAG TPA: DedA family protein [Ktedonobacterales bacterium]|nr:DedA family protein [Ktedonobacterales bacterium]
MQDFIHGLETVPPVVTYAFAFIWLAFESCGLPLPNELVLLLLGSLIEQRGSPGELVALVVVATAGSLLGATTAYFIGARGGRKAVLRVGRYLRLNEARLEAVERWLANSTGFAIGIARITPFVRTVASFPAGVLRLPLRTFIIATSIGSLLWCVALVTVGYILGEDYMLAVHFIETYTVPAVIILVALAGGYLWLHQRLAHVGAPGRTETSAPVGDGVQPRRDVSRERQRPQR